MLKREDAQKALETYRLKDWQERRLTELATLPEALNALGRRMLRVDLSHREPYWQPFDQAIKLARPEQHQLFEVLFPQISQTILQACDLITTLPFQMGSNRRAFRSRQPIHHQDSQRAFIQSMLGRFMAMNNP